MPGLFKSFFMGGFECSTHRRRDGKRLDLLYSTGHAQWPGKDFAAMENCAIRTVRSGLRWHLIETRPGVYDWGSLLPMLRAARAQGTQVIWDLCHYGYPDDVNIWQPQFVERFARFATAAAQVIKDEGDAIPFYSPINEISFWSWAGGDVGYFNPGAEHRGMELKHQLVRASIAAIEAIRGVAPGARFIQADPLIHVMPATRRNDEIEAAENYRRAQFEAWDLLSGRQWPGLGGRPEYLDVLGANFYPHNQWIFNGRRVMRGEPEYRPFSGMLRELFVRYGRPILVSETGAEDEQRVPWFRYVTDQVKKAVQAGVPVEGICWYPILDYPGWDDGRYCPAGLLGYADGQGQRAAFHPLQVAIREADKMFETPHSSVLNAERGR
ncbi:family 1 glycosylhydrolase [Pseudomonas alliivorans]|uniref:family 1 glycosylhydrolase n=1 Tax=Pseudomonas alliivorans TaxID=2810613 RepID=UPI001AE636F4|nr:family 1 glycosylhydrolase [Pseudomonas alliivorans]MBP0943363.1 family 1 glycosylhydrolase [Pseudomonas alliivorans]MEE4881412.1 family 1 glycosylhydrolase [Pseudomonas alliivorans]MEE4932865.1 family 1 glycosylhydrolase [Pseudomonas alliivorans]MEE4938229.1 family 1 glycosylhydrolase [Pseudomonas alliivorans]MEE4943352.1 family 1 glycosylhydrolase [Pseudomonas alliivorans]